MKGIIFSAEPLYEDTVKLLVISPPGINYEHEYLGDHFFGSGNWLFVEPPMQQRAPARIPRELLETRGFRYGSVNLEWDDFLDDVYDTMDFILFYNPETQQLHEVSRDALAVQSPANYSFSFFDIATKESYTNRSTDMADENFVNAQKHIADLMAKGWTVAAISKFSGVNQITLGNIKNNKSSRLTDKVYQKIFDFKKRAEAGEFTQPVRGRRSPAQKGTGKAPAKATPKTKATPKATAKVKASASPGASEFPSIISPNYVSVDITQLQSVIDTVIENFTQSLSELQNLKKMLKR